MTASSGSIVAICLTFSKHPQKLEDTKQSLHCQRPVHGVQHVAVALYIACCYIASSSLLTLVADVLTFVSIPKLDSALPVRLSVGVQEWDRCVTYFELFQPLLEHLNNFVYKHLVTARSLYSNHVHNMSQHMS